jgi:hypothetical protein
VKRLFLSWVIAMIPATALGQTTISGVMFNYPEVFGVPRLTGAVVDIYGPDAGISLIQNGPRGTRGTESFIAPFAADADGRIMKQGSISWMWMDPAKPYGYAITRFNTSYMDWTRPGNPGIDDIVERHYGGRGACYFCTSDWWWDAPGFQVLRVRGTLRLTTEATPATQGTRDAPVDTTTPCGFIRMIKDETQEVIYVPYYKATPCGS